MTDEPIDQKLRALAEHRGLKLLKSRKRTPGSGDYGKFGLTDADGKALLGMGRDGLTAAPEEVEAFLREGAASDWAASAKTTPARPAGVKPRPTDDEEDHSLAIRPRTRRAPLSGRKSPRKTAAGVAGSGVAEADQAVARPSTKNGLADDDGRGPAGASTPKARAARPVPQEQPVAPEPAELVIRAARPGDAADLAALLRPLKKTKVDELSIARSLGVVRKAGGGTVIALQGKLVGCCSWATLATFQHGLVGRITLLFVDKRHRRQSVATAMLAEAAKALGKAGCAQIEVMSDIEIDNAHNFFRALKFEQTSYRFAKDITSD